MPDRRPRPDAVRQATPTACGSCRRSSPHATAEPPAMSTHQDDPRVDELRQRLRSLGYLDAGVDRFVLGPARGARRPAAIALLSSLRVGALAAAMLGPAAATGIRARLPDLVTGPRDAMVIALYLAMLLRRRGRGRRLRRRACSRRPSPGAWPERSGDRSRIVSRASGVIVTLAMPRLPDALVARGRRRRRLGGAVLDAIRARRRRHDQPRARPRGIDHVVGGHRRGRRRTRERAARTRGVLRSWPARSAFGAAALLLTVSTRGAPAVAPPPLTVVSSGLRLRVIAIDGFDARLLDELTAAGRVPALAQAMRGAALRFGEADDRDPGGVATRLAPGPRSRPASRRASTACTRLETRRVAGVQGSLHAADPSAFARTAARRDRPDAADAAGGRQRRRTAREDLLGSRGGCRAAHGGRQLVGDVAGENRRRDESSAIGQRCGSNKAGRSTPSSRRRRSTTRCEGSGRRSPRAAAARAAAALGAAPAADDTRVLLERSARLDALQLALLDAHRRARHRPFSRLSARPRHRAACVAGRVGRHRPRRWPSAWPRYSRYYVVLDRLLASELAPRRAGDGGRDHRAGTGRGTPGAGRCRCWAR